MIEKLYESHRLRFREPSVENSFIYLYTQTLDCIEDEASLTGLELESIEESAFYMDQHVFLVKFKNKHEYYFMKSELMTKMFPIKVIQFYESRLVPIKGENKLNEIFGDRLLDWKHVIPRGIIYRQP